MNDSKDPNFPMFELYLATAEKVSDRRAQAHSWMLSVAFLVFTATALSYQVDRTAPPKPKPDS